MSLSYKVAGALAWVGAISTVLTFTANAAPMAGPGDGKAPKANYRERMLGQLRGIGESFGLLVVLGPEFKGIGIDPDSVQKAVRRRFKDNGIQVIESTALPTLTFAFTAHLVDKDKKGEVYLVGIELQAKEIATSLQRRENLSILATVWSRYTFGLYRKNSDPAGVVEVSRDLIDLFANDYKASNH